MASERAVSGLRVAGAAGLSGALLTGGRSSRLGTDKASFDPFGEGSMLNIGTCALLAAGCTEVASVGGALREDQPEGVVHLHDLHPDQGPLGGIITALQWASNDLVVVLACDMPFVDGAVVAALADKAVGAAQAAVVVARVGGRAQPLTAVWRRSVALPALETGFAEGVRAPRLILPRLVCQFVDDVDPERILDIDSPDDVERYAPISERRRAGE